MARHTRNRRPTTIALVCRDPYRVRAFTAAVAAEPQLRMVRVLGSLADRLPRRCEVLIVDHDFETAMTELVLLADVARKRRVIVASVSTLRTDVWMARRCGAIGYLPRVQDLAVAVSAVASGGQHWPSGLGAPPEWMAEPETLTRVCAFARERERSRYARLIHDNVLQTLEGLALSPAIANPGLKMLLTQEAQWLRGLIQDGSAGGAVRLVAELESVIAQHRGDPLEVVLAIEDSAEPALTPPAVRALADATNEALRNTTKHSTARTARVAVVSGRDVVCVRIADSGVGFDPAAVAPGFGLSESIAARMSAVGGTATVRSVLGQGTVVELTAPLAG